MRMPYNFTFTIFIWFIVYNVHFRQYPVHCTGDNMVPMSDQAVLKQNQLRNLRLEMLKVMPENQ